MGRPRFRQPQGATRRSNEFKPYKNRFESEVAALIPGWVYEDKKAKVDYVIHKTYNPDFTCEEHPWLLIETKGIFLGGAQEAQKYTSFKKCHPEKVIFFIFENPNLKAYGQCRKRADGSFLTMAEWASTNGFPFCHCTKIPWYLAGKYVDDKLLRDEVESLIKKQAQQFAGRMK